MQSRAFECKTKRSQQVLTPAVVFCVLMSARLVLGGSIYNGPLIAQSSITLNGNVIVDSYDSRDTNYSTGGLYDPVKRKDGGNLVVNGYFGYFGGSITVGNSVDIYGRGVFANPGGTNSMLGSAALGSTNWINSGAIGIEQGWLIEYDSGTIFFPYTPPPPTNAPFALPVKTSNMLDGVTYSNSYLLTAGNYEQASNFSMITPDKMLISGAVNLHFSGSVSMGGSSQIIIGTNSSLTIHLFTDATFGGGGILNNTKNPTNCTIWGDYDWHGSRVSSVTLSGGTPFCGNIYVPTAQFRATGPGASVLHMYGSIVGNTISASGKVQIHYDEALPIWPLLFGSDSKVGAAIIAHPSGPGIRMVYVQGMHGYTYALESSTNLTDWSRVMTNTSPFAFTNIPTDVPHQFYRAVYLP